jgi:hypothetical protein
MKTYTINLPCPKCQAAMTTTGEIGTALAVCTADPAHRRTIFIDKKVDGEKWARFKRGRTPSGLPPMVTVGVKAPAWSTDWLARFGMTHHELHKLALAEFMRNHPRTLDTDT